MKKIIKHNMILNTVVWRSAKLPIFILCVLCVLFFVISCNNSDTLTPEEPIDVVFKSQMRISTGSNNAQETWIAGDEIGIYMRKTGVELSSSSILAGANNKKFIAQTSTNMSNMKPADDSQHIVYSGSDRVDFIAYYPYKNSGAEAGMINNFIYPIDLSNQADVSKIDLLYSNNVKNKGADQIQLTQLSFKHALNKIVVKPIKGEGMSTADFSHMQVKVHMHTKAQFKLSNGAISNMSDMKTIDASTITAGSRYEAIIVPQGGIANRTFIFSLGDDKYTWHIPETMAFNDTGKAYIYTVAINKTGVEIVTTDIVHWNETGGIQIADPENRFSIPMTIIKAGSFWMGSPDGTNGTIAEYDRDPFEEIQHYVTLTRDFKISKREVTCGEYSIFLNSVGVGMDGTYMGGLYPGEILVSPDKNFLEYKLGQWTCNSVLMERPIANVTWYGAAEFANWIGGRLPTEAEWEYVARGTTSENATNPRQTKPFGIASGLLLHKAIAVFDWRFPYALYGMETISSIVPNYPSMAGTVNSTNEYGVYEMHGNMAEWCADWYEQGYSPESVVDPKGPAMGSRRILRGGSWQSTSVECRSAARSSAPPVMTENYIGFRVVMPLYK